MNTLDLTPFLDSPRLPDFAAAINERLQSEAAARVRFYDEMTDGEKVEFIGGEVIMHSPARSRHMQAKSQLARLLSVYVDVQKLGTVFDEKCLCVFPRNDYESDIVFFGPEKSATITPETMKFPVPDFVVEVLSDTTEHRDRGVKFEDFEAHGVGEYWIVDAANEIVEQYLIEDGTFQIAIKSGSGEIVSRVVSGFQIPIRAIFNLDENLTTLKYLCR